MTVRPIIDGPLSGGMARFRSEVTEEAKGDLSYYTAFGRKIIKEFCLAEADDFEREVETLRGSQAFQRFLEERSAWTKRIPLQELAAQGKTT